MSRNVRLILTDIDGTILPYGQRIVSARARAAFHAALDAGIRIGPASGRGFSHIPASFAGDTACSATCLAANGMQVYLDGILLYQAFLPYEPLRELARLVADIPHTGLICFEEGVPLLVEGTVDDLRQSFPTYAEQARFAEHVPTHPIEKANVFVAGSMDVTRDVFERLSNSIPEFDFNVPMAGFLNMTPSGWSKASGIDVLCEAMGITLDDVVVFGDGGNDVEMLAHVPNSVAVEGAEPEATAAARWHIGRCEDEATVAAIEALATGHWPFG